LESELFILHLADLNQLLLISPLRRVDQAMTVVLAVFVPLVALLEMIK
jgi:hypothetical protein